MKTGVDIGNYCDIMALACRSTGYPQPQKPQSLHPAFRISFPSTVLPLLPLLPLCCHYSSL